MVHTRKGKKDLEDTRRHEQCSNDSVKAADEAGNEMDLNLPGPSTVQSDRKSTNKKLSTTSSIAKRRKLLELRAEEEKTRVRMELIDQKLAADIAQMEMEEGSCSSQSKEPSEQNNDLVEEWLENSKQVTLAQCTTRHEPVADKLLQPERPENSRYDKSTHDAGLQPSIVAKHTRTLETAPTSPPQAVIPGGTDENVVHALSSALKDLAAASARGYNDKLINRLCTPRDLPAYSGDPLEWLQFKVAYEESSQVCNFSERENLWRLRKSLHGAAKEAVTALLIGATSPEAVMSTLELQFGNPDVIISRILQDIQKLRQIPPDYQRDIIPFSIKVKNYVAAVTAIGCDEYLQGMNIVSIILSKLPTVLVSKWTDYSYPLFNQRSKPKLVILSEFLSEEAVKITKTFVSVQSYSKHSYSDKYRNRTQTILFNNELSDTCSKETVCRFCRISKHALPDCKKFKKSLRKDRWTFVKRHGLCYKCLTSQHKQNNCPEPVCDIDSCGQSHHRLLHYTINKNSKPNSNVHITEVSETEPRVDTITHININNCKVLLKTVPIYLHGPSGVVRSCALLDDGSTVTLISDELAARAGLRRGNKQTMRVCGAWDNSEIVCDSEIMDFDVSNREGTMFSIRARCVKNMDLPVQNVSADELCNFELMKSEIKNIISDEKCKPELLIGQDNYELLLPLQIIKGKPNETYLTRTPLGWCIHGCLRSRCTALATPRSTLFLYENRIPVSTEAERILRDMHEDLRQSFALESVGISTKPRQNIEEVRACEHLERTAKLIDGKWHVGLPWKDMNSKMPNSYRNAVTRLKGIENKIKFNSGYAERYKDRMNHLFSNDYASEIESSQTSDRTWYLPHFGVDNPNKQKLRLVFDAAARSEDVCLNDYLWKGPDLLISLYGIMLRFRENKIAVTGDIRDMFLRIKVQKEDRNALRFLWKESPDQPIKTYAMSSLIFGANCSPFVAQFIKNKNAKRYEKSMPEAVQAVYRQHYMDDYIDSLEDEQTAAQLVNDITYIHKQGGFEIRNWTSNNQTVFNNLPNHSIKSSVSFKNGQPYDGERTLGLIWFPTDDTLGFDVSFKRIPKLIMTGQKKPTKREMLRVLMSIFDVYGFLSPVTIKGKIILQDTWKSEIKWDDEITDEIFIKWLHWINIMKSINSIRLPRCYTLATRDNGVPATTTSVSEMQTLGTRAPNNQSPPASLLNVPTDRCRGTSRYTNLDLHVFCDASSKAMCAVAYWRWIDNNKQIQVAFVSSKCRVAPVKYMSIPRLELQAAVIAGRLADSICKEHRIKPIKRHFWCDSATVLHWIRNNNKNYKSYIAHRLGEIDELTQLYEWRYIPTKLNVADIATRETCEIKTLQNEWLYGPIFLKENEDLWPTVREQLDASEMDLECINNISFTPVYLPAVPDPERFSSWLRLLKSTCVILRFIEKCKKLTCNADQRLMERAENLLLMYSQMKSFPDDLHNLKHKKELDKKSKLLTLSPMLDEDGILRLAGRIDAVSEISSAVKRPVILDGRCHVTHLIVRHYHVRACHGNQEMVVNELKQRYWIIRLRPTVKHITSQCMLCRIKKAQPQPPRMGDLPEARMAHHQRPFTHTGLDLFGPLEVTAGRSRIKRYGVIFTCLTVRAIHIEIVSQLTTDALIMALRRMASRRGWPRYLYSDNGTNMRGADTELKKCIQELDEQQLNEEIINYSTATTWTFNPPASPHWGGAWERLIRNIKTALKVIMKERAPREETLLTLMAEVEHMVNSRPLTHVTVEPGTNESLTPNHFLLGTSSNLPVLGTYNESAVYLRKQWRISQMLADMFWRRWVCEVLPDMRPRPKWHKEQRPLQVGDLVLVVDPSSPRNVWPKGLIEAVIPGKDGKIRVVDIKLKSGILRRSAVRVARIATGSECCASTGEGSVDDT